MLIRDRLGVVVKLFLCGQSLDSADVEEFVPKAVRGAFEALGLLEKESSRTIAPVLLYPAYGLYLTSDRYMNPDGSEVSTGSDFVFLVLQPNVTDFISFTPDSPCETFLDLAAGCGVAALWAAKNFAAHTWSSDITERASHFAEFNRRLNGIVNAAVVQGDMYAQVAGLKFDRITTHPPYAMNPKSRYVYADGGEDGETLIRRALSEAPAHLMPGGIFSCTSMAADRRGQPLEHRVRQWLGDAGGGHDVAIVVDEIIQPLTYATEIIGANKGHLRELEQWRDLFQRHQVERLVYGALVVRRHAQAGQAPFTVRRMRSPQTTRACVDWMLAWEAAAAQPDRDQMLLASRPMASPRAELVVRHQSRDGELRPLDYTFRTQHPFDASVKCPSWAAYLFSRCDGRRTGADLFAEVRPNLPAEGGKEEFMKGLSTLISNGFVEIEPFRIPSHLLKAVPITLGLR
jgi:methylase of polypeptide subunit release factors